MSDSKLIEIFEEGAAAAIANVGIGQWTNPYHQMSADAQRCGAPSLIWKQKATAWDYGWAWQVVQMNIAASVAVCSPTQQSAMQHG